MKAVIVGGVAGGASAAARIRRLDEHAQIIIFERSEYVSYANCGLPYYIGGVIADPQELTLHTPESLWKRFKIDVKTRHEVTSVNPLKKTVTVHNLRSGRIYEESYDKLLLATGAKPILPDMPGIDSQKLFTLRTVEDTLKISRFIEEKCPKSAIMIGGGFISLETAENLCRMGIKTFIVQSTDHLLNTFDYDMASFIHAELRQKGVQLILGSMAEGFEDTDCGIRVLFKDRRPLKADMALLAVGAAPDTYLAESAGLKLGIKGSIITNDRMETSVPDIYAVGDAVQIKHIITGRDTLISLAGPANKQGRTAADNICGGDSHYKGSAGSSIIKIFDLTAASAGLTERAAQSEKIDYEKIVLSPSSHASYYPGAKTMTMKIIFEKKTQKLLGAQIIGPDGADKRLDVLAAAMTAKMKASDLKDLDLAYAPPYSSAKDPVNMAGFIIDNIVSGKIKQFHWNEAAALPRDGSVSLLDTRTVSEYSQGHAQGFINIPLDDLRRRFHELDKNKPVYVMCQSGLRSYNACRILMQEGYDCFNFSGGYRFYSSVMLELKTAECTYPCGMDK